MGKQYPLIGEVTKLPQGKASTCFDAWVWVQLEDQDTIKHRISYRPDGAEQEEGICQK